jgi:hypothetical protein
MAWRFGVRGARAYGLLSLAHADASLLEAAKATG